MAYNCRSGHVGPPGLCFCSMKKQKLTSSSLIEFISIVYEVHIFFLSTNLKYISVHNSHYATETSSVAFVPNLHLIYLSSGSLIFHAPVLVP